MIKKSKMEESSEEEEEEVVKYEFPLKHPFRFGSFGRSGTGKTTLLINLLAKKAFFKGRFDATYLISATAYNDQKLSSEVIDYGKGGRIPFYSDEIMKKLIEEVMNDPSIKKALVGFDDVTGEKLRKGGATDAQSELSKFMMNLKNYKKYPTEEELEEGLPDESDWVRTPYSVFSVLFFAHHSVALGTVAKDQFDGLAVNNSIGSSEVRQLRDYYTRNLSEQDIEEMLNLVKKEKGGFLYIHRPAGETEFRKGFYSPIDIEE